jgi:hypothetical protein
MASQSCVVPPTGVCLRPVAESVSGDLLLPSDAHEFEVLDTVAERLAYQVGATLPWFALLQGVTLMPPRIRTRPFRLRRSAGLTKEQRAAVKNWNTLRRFASHVTYAGNAPAGADEGGPIREAELRRFARRLAMLWGLHARGVRGISMACPTFFRACCRDAACGGAQTYASAGWHLALHVSGFGDDFEEADWGDVIDELRACIDDDAAAWSWFEDHVPRCASLVPEKRRAKFLSGVRQAHADGRL